MLTIQRNPWAFQWLASMFHHMLLEMLVVKNPWADPPVELGCFVNKSFAWSFGSSNRFKLPWTSKHVRLVLVTVNETLCWLMGGHQIIKDTDIPCAEARSDYLHRNVIYAETVQIKRSIDHQVSQVNHYFPNGVTWSSNKSVAWSSNTIKYRFFR